MFRWNRQRPLCWWTIVHCQFHPQPPKEDCSFIGSEDRVPRQSYLRNARCRRPCRHTDNRSVIRGSFNWKIWRWRANKVPTMTPDHHRRRLRWCRGHSRWNRQEWQNVLFSDESRFCLHKNDGRVQVWRRRGERPTAACVKGSKAFNGGSVMIWAGVNFHGKTRLVFVDGNINARRYINEILVPVAQPHLIQMGPNAVCQQTARITTAHFQRNQVDVMEWPACSPDLNPIEHLWDQLGRSVRAHMTPNHTLAHLQEEWDRCPRPGSRLW